MSLVRARNLKPGLLKNEVLGVADPLYTILFTGLWMAADREGRLEDRPLRIKAEVMPYRNVDCDALLDWLEEQRFITRYEVGGQACIQVANFAKHQKPHHMEPPSVLPPPPGATNRYNHSPITKVQRSRIFARDGGKCALCGKRGEHIDHIHPVSAGGGSEDSNLRVLCQKCNLSKGARIEDDSSSSRDRIDIEPIDSLNGALTPSCLTADSGILTPDTGPPAPPGQGGAPRRGDGPGDPGPDLQAELAELTELKAVYPRRAGNQPWRRAVRALAARIGEGHDWGEFIAGARRYAEYIRAAGKENTEFVMYASTFLGPDKHFLEPWNPPASKAQRAQDANIDASKAWLRDQEAADAAG